MKQYLTFSLINDLYAFAIADVESVVEYTTLTKMPNVEKYLIGLLNLRGATIPVVDLRLKFGLLERGAGVLSYIIVLSATLASGKILIGAVADEVHEVITMEEGMIEAAPTVGTIKGAAQAFITGIGKKDERFILLLDTRSAYAESMEELAQPALAEAIA